MRRSLGVIAVAILLVATIGIRANAQTLTLPIEDCSILWFPKKHDCTVELDYGVEISGKLISGSGAGSTVDKFTIQRADGGEQEFFAADVIQLKVRASDLIRFMQMQEGASSIAESMHTDWENSLEKDYLIFKPLTTGKKKQTTRLHMLLNSGFNNCQEVYDNPGDNESGALEVGAVQITGGKPRSYLLVSNDARPVLISKKNYSEQFDSIFGDCRGHLTGSNKPKWDNFALHIWQYNTCCTQKLP